MSYCKNATNNHVWVWGVPPPDCHTLCTSQWLNPNEEWRVLNIVSSHYQPVPVPMTQVVQVQQHACPMLAFKPPPPVEDAKTKSRNWKKLPLWKRRGAKPIQQLRLHPNIRGDLSWEDKVSGCDDLLQIVTDTEWQSLHPNYFEVHSLKDVEDGVVIDPKTYPAWYGVTSVGSPVAAMLPNGSEALLKNALQEGYSLDTLILSMGTVVSNYSMGLMHRKRRDREEALVLARQKSWQGASAIAAATRLLRHSMRVSVFIQEERGIVPCQGNVEEDKFIAAGGKVYRNLEELKGRKFRLVIVALEDQHSGRTTQLPIYGELLQHAVALFLDPPILKCSYTTALQIATQGCYNMCQKTILLTPFLPKPYIPDNFVELFVVDGGLTEDLQRSAGITHTVFPRLNGSRVENVVPLEFTVKGSRLYFYRDGKRVPC